MYKCSPKEIIAAVPGVQTVQLDPSWFSDLPSGKSVFESLYDWMTETGRIPDENHKTLHSRTYVSDKVFKKLLAAERKRLRKKLKIKGDELEESVNWSDLASGPKKVIGECRISGDVILVVPEKDCDALDKFSVEIRRKNRDRHISKIRENASGADFYGWLVSQIERPDRVGDLARDAEPCGGLPRGLVDYEDYLSFVHESGFYNAIESLNEAWLEYSQQYPERIRPAAWCSECGKRMLVNAAHFVWDEDSGEISVLDGTCFERYRGFSPVKSVPLSGISAEDIKEIAEQNHLSKWDVERVIGKLHLWGILPQQVEGTIYFFGCETTREIKIGITSGRVEKRMATVQTSRGHKINLLATLPGTTKCEQALHDRFSQHRLQGEWFRPHPEILAYISQLQGSSKVDD